MKKDRINKLVEYIFNLQYGSINKMGFSIRKEDVKDIKNNIKRDLDIFFS